MVVPWSLDDFPPFFLSNRGRRSFNKVCSCFLSNRSRRSLNKVCPCFYLDVGPNHFFSNSSRVEFSKPKFNRVELLVLNFEPNRTEANRAELGVFSSSAPFFSCLSPHPFCLSPHPFCLSPRPFCLSPRPFCLSPRPFGPMPTFIMSFFFLRPSTDVLPRLHPPQRPPVLPLRRHPPGPQVGADGGALRGAGARAQGRHRRGAARGARPGRQREGGGAGKAGEISAIFLKKFFCKYNIFVINFFPHKKLL